MLCWGRKKGKDKKEGSEERKVDIYAKLQETFECGC